MPVDRRRIEARVRLNRLAIGGWSAQALFAANELGVFDLLKEGRSMTAAEVAAELGTEEEGLLAQRTEARVVPVASLEPLVGRPAAVPHYLLDDLELTDSGTELDEAKHVMAVKLGENAFLVRLERFLLNREDEIERLLVEEGRP